MRYSNDTSTIQLNIIPIIGRGGGVWDIDLRRKMRRKMHGYCGGRIRIFHRGERGERRDNVGSRVAVLLARGAPHVHAGLR